MEHVFVDGHNTQIIWISELENNNVVVKIEPIQVNDIEVKDYIEYKNNTYKLSKLIKKDIYWYCNFKPINL